MASVDRKHFLTQSLAAAAAAAAGGVLGGDTLGGRPAAAQQTAPRPARDEPPQPRHPLRLLILGGTGFIGPYQVRYALARGHKVTIFNRGRTNPGLFPADQVEQLLGDRSTGDLSALKGRQWDAVIDNPATLPRWVREAAGLLKDAARQYLFISTVSVYADNGKPGQDESAPLATTDAPDAAQVTGENYGALKALAEQEAQRAFAGRATVVRPGLIVGPGDPSDRFTYWPVRIARGGEVLAPGDGSDPVQFIDARDLAEWCVRMVEQNATGVYNALGPRSPLRMDEMLYGIRAITSADVRFTWVPAAFLEAQKVRPWTQMPVWVPGTGDSAGFSRRSNARALAKGLTFRPLADTARAALEAHQAALQAQSRAGKPVDQTRVMGLYAGLGLAREAQVLSAWRGGRAGAGTAARSKPLPSAPLPRLPSGK